MASAGVQAIAADSDEQQQQQQQQQQEKQQQQQQQQQPRLRVPASRIAPKYSEVLSARKNQRANDAAAPARGPPVFRLGPNVARSVKRFLLSRGWREWEHQAASLEAVGPDSEMIDGPVGDSARDDDNSDGSGEESSRQAAPWNLYWKDSPFTRELIDSLNGQQRLNHFRNTIAITRKDRLSINLDLMSRLEYGHVVDCMPRTFRVPKHEQTWKGVFNASCLEYQSQLAAQASGKAQGPPPETLWIYKPASSRRGKGIFVFPSTPEGWQKYKDARASVESRKSAGGVVQQYLSNPLLLGGFKFDLRLYVLVTSWWPLKAYIHRRGLVRFSTEPYTLDNLDDLTVHLTNSSINKNAPGAKLDKPTIGRGCKWTLDRLWEELSRVRPDIDQKRLWHQVRELVLTSVLPGVGNVPSDPHCYEILGFDVILDNNGRPWLLEINRSPAMAQQTAVDRVVKTAVLNGVFQINGLHHWEKGDFVDVYANRLNHFRSMARIEASFSNPAEGNPAAAAAAEGSAASKSEADSDAMEDDAVDGSAESDAGVQVGGGGSGGRYPEMDELCQRTGFDLVFPSPDYHLKPEVHASFSYHRLEQAALAGEEIDMAQESLLPQSVEEMSRYHNTVLKCVHDRRQAMRAAEKQ